MFFEWCKIVLLLKQIVLVKLEKCVRDAKMHKKIGVPAGQVNDFTVEKVFLLKVKS